MGGYRERTGEAESLDDLHQLDARDPIIRFCQVKVVHPLDVHGEILEKDGVKFYYTTPGVANMMMFTTIKASAKGTSLLVPCANTIPV